MWAEKTDSSRPQIHFNYVINFMLQLKAKYPASSQQKQHKNQKYSESYKDEETSKISNT